MGFGLIMGRPRKYPEGATGYDRVAAGNAALVQAGGARKQFLFRPETMRALESLRRSRGGTDTEIVQWAILSAAERC